MFRNRILRGCGVLFALIVVYTAGVFAASGVKAIEEPSSGTASSGLNAEQPPQINELGYEPFDQQIEIWIHALSKQPPFLAWSRAKWTTIPLGPGQHGWAVLLTDKGTEIGYMIIQAAEDGSLRLSDFGTSPTPLFSLNTLYQSLVQRELIPSSMTYSDFAQSGELTKEAVYDGAFYALWKVGYEQSQYVVDANEGELWPIREEDIQKRLKTGLALPAGAKLALGPPAITLTNPAFDPYDRLPWVQGVPLSIRQGVDLRLALDLHAQITYIALPFAGTITIPYAVIGYAKWGGIDYVTLQRQQTIRYVNLQDAIASGAFYP